MPTETRMFVKIDVLANNNKFWEISIDDNGNVTSRNGRVGAEGQRHDLGNGRILFEKRIRAKIREKYREIDRVSPGVSSSPVSNDELLLTVEEQIGRGNEVIVNRTSQANLTHLVEFEL